MNRILPLLVAAAALGLGACGGRREPPVPPPPLGHAHAPVTSVLGAGPGAGAQLGNCGVAVACVAQPGTQGGTYWTMVLGRR